MTHLLTSKQTVFCWSAQFLAAIIMFQTLFFKFSGAEESIYIFSKVGIEPWGRYAIAVTELIASTLLLIPAYCWVGAFMGIGLMTGAVIAHLTVLGISVKNDGGYLFLLALTTLLACSTVLYLRRHQIPYVNKFFSSQD